MFQRLTAIALAGFALIGPGVAGSFAQGLSENSANEARRSSDAAAAGVTAGEESNAAAGDGQTPHSQTGSLESAPPVVAVPRFEHGPILTNVSQFHALSDPDFQRPGVFHLKGAVTFVDTNRQLFVVQDATAAVALHFDWRDAALAPGKRVSVWGTNFSPYAVTIPDFPYRPSGREILPSFEGPTDDGDYYLARVRGYLHPPVSGHYTFWLASDNSSELRLAPGSDPGATRQIAILARYRWVERHEWAKYPTQRSEPIWLEAGKVYYIEALHEQTTVKTHLAVAWQGPTIRQSIIDGRYLTPWINPLQPEFVGRTNGILREFWKNYPAGLLTPLTTPRAYQSMLSVERGRVTVEGEGGFPAADPVLLDQTLTGADNFRWVELEGRVTFVGISGDQASLEVTDGQSRVRVHIADCSPERAKGWHHAAVQVRGVCEAGYDSDGKLRPHFVWVPNEQMISHIESATQVSFSARRQTRSAATNSAMEGFYLFRGVVTFSDPVLGNQFFIQDDVTAHLVALTKSELKNRWHEGQWLEVAGHLQPGSSPSLMMPLFVMDMGLRALPEPVSDPLRLPVPPDREGRWTEVEGVARAVNANGTLTLGIENGTLQLWIGRTPSNVLSGYVDAKLRARGVLSSRTFESPALLAPSRSFVDVIREPETDPFRIPAGAIGDLAPELNPAAVHRTRLQGTIVYSNASFFVLQDATGGIRVKHARDAQVNVKVGGPVEVVGFPMMEGGVRVLAEPMVRPAGKTLPVETRRLEISDPLSSRQRDTLVLVEGTVLVQKQVEALQILELQERGRVFAASLPMENGKLPDIAPGSRLRITGVCQRGAAAVADFGEAFKEEVASGSLNILLRSPADVLVLSGPPWWTWRRTAGLVGTLLFILAVALTWVHLLRRRLERQKAAQLAFSRKILESLEDERRRIAVNLHDGLGQVLLAIRSQALLAMQRTPDEAGLRQRLNEISGASSQAIEEVREITHGLRPYQLDRLGLTRAIRTAVDLAADSNAISFATRVDGVDDVFDKDAEIHVYRIVQEAVNNIVKHSGATEAAVVIKNQGSAVSLSVRDNGKGFDVEAIQAASGYQLGYGLSGIAERVRILGGTFHIESHPGDGTSLSIEIPAPVRQS